MSKHNIVHIEIPTRNGAESGKFFKDLFGWKISHDEKMDYTMWEPEAEPGGGFNNIGEHTKAGEVLIYVDSSDIDADLKKAEKLGGKIVTPKMEITGVGWFGTFKDPSGNTIALFTALNPR